MHLFYIDNQTIVNLSLKNNIKEEADEKRVNMSRRGFILLLFVCLFIPSLTTQTGGIPSNSFGGSGYAYTEAADHPENQWVKQSPREGAPVPALGYEGSGSYDPVNQKWIHHAGHDGHPQGFYTFTFDLKTGIWEQKFPNTSPPGVCGVHGANVFDIAHQRFVAFPGSVLGHGYQMSRGVRLKSSPVWLYDLSTNRWMNMRPPPYPQITELGRFSASATYDSKHEVAISFGGSGGANNLTVYDAYSNRLARLNAENPPPARDGAGLCYDPKNDVLVMFGSHFLDDERTWLYRYSTGKWESHDLTPRPVAKRMGRCFHENWVDVSTNPKLVFDSASGLVLCVTWHGSDAGRHETWTFDAAKLQWTKMNPPVEPEPSLPRSRNLSYIAEENLFILELITPTTPWPQRPEIWTYRIKNAPANAPPTVPTDLMVTTGSNNATLTWKPVDGSRRFQVLRGEGDEVWNVKYEQIATVNVPRFEDTGLTSGKTYFYRVKAVAADGTVSQPSLQARTQPRVLIKPVVSVLADNKVEINWAAHPVADVKGYNVYRGLVSVRSLQKGTPDTRDNDPEYSQPMPVEVSDITDIRKLNDQLLTSTQWTDNVDLKKNNPTGDEYRFHVYAYIIRAVNNLGTESGPSPYALTIPSEPENVFCREDADGTAELKWDASPEKRIAGYRVYRLRGTGEIVPVAVDPIIQGTTFSHQPPADGGHTKNRTRYWVTAVDAIGQEGQPSSPAWYNHPLFKGYYQGEWHQ